jgi:endonuclease YncB( thermonuclease family)
VNVVDGDTVDVECRYVVRVRIIDLWCPETRTKNEQEKQQGLLAKRHMKNLAEGQRAVLFVPTASAVSTKDVLTLERTLGHIWLDGDEVSLAEHMIESGYGYKEKPK